MFKIVITTILVSAFFILFFEPNWNLKNKTERKKPKKKVKASTTAGFIEDTHDAFIIPSYPSQLMTRDNTGKIKPIYGDIGTFVPYSSVPEDNWLHGFPHEKPE
jgi:hypothetical protein